MLLKHRNASMQSLKLALRLDLRSSCRRPLRQLRSALQPRRHFSRSAQYQQSRIEEAVNHSSNWIKECPPPTCACASMPEGLDIDFEKPMRCAVPFYTQHLVLHTGKDDWSSRIEEDNDGNNLAKQLKDLTGPKGKFFDVRGAIITVRTCLTKLFASQSRVGLSSSRMDPFVALNIHKVTRLPSSRQMFRSTAFDPRTSNHSSSIFPAPNPA